MWGTVRQAGERQVIAPDERLACPADARARPAARAGDVRLDRAGPRTDEFPVSTTIFFSGVGTLLFVLMTRNRVPSYTGSSFAFIAPVTAAQMDGGMRVALGGIFVAGVVVFLIGLLIDRIGTAPLDWLLPPVVTGAIVALIGLNLGPVAKDQFSQQAGIALVTLVAIVLIGVAVRGFVSSLSVFLGVVIGYVFAAIVGKVDWSGVHDAAWFGFPDFATPEFQWQGDPADRPGRRARAAGRERRPREDRRGDDRADLDGDIGRSFMGDGLATTVPGLFGGSATTTYGENIGVMGLTRVYSTLAYVIAGLVAIALGLLPKFGAVSGAPRRRPRRRGHRPLRADRGPRRPGLDRRASRLPRPGQPHHRRRGADRRRRQLHAELGRLQFAGIALGTVAAIVTYQILRPLSGRNAFPSHGPRTSPGEPMSGSASFQSGRSMTTSSPLKLPSTSSSTPSSERT